MKGAEDYECNLTMDERSVACAIAGWKRPANDMNMNMNISMSSSGAKALAPTSTPASLEVVEPRQKVAKTSHVFSQSQSQAATPIPIAPLHMNIRGAGTGTDIGIGANIFCGSGAPVGAIGSTSACTPKTAFQHSNTHQIQQYPIHSMNMSMTSLPPSQIHTPYASSTIPDPAAVSVPTESQEPQERELLPAPFFHYRDFSRQIDDDPLTPLTPLSRVPNFPAKMHAILSRPALSDIVT